MTIRIHGTPESLADAAAEEITRWLSLDDSRTIGLAGGSTPRPAYERLRAAALPWDEVQGWMTDERHVQVSHPDSNAGMAREALFDHVPATLHEVPWRHTAEEAARAYEASLAEVLPAGPEGSQPGLVLLGVGDDGHTASLFPSSTALDETDRDYVATEVPGKGWRLTATFRLLQRARRTIFLVSGEAKAPVVAEIISGDSNLPAARVFQEARDPVWLLDRDAASEL